MRIVAGAWRGRSLVAPPGQGTRPTADRVRQALFDMLMHADWAGRAAIENAAVLDVFAGTGALGLEALSRGAATAAFIESDLVALRALRANVAACRAEDRVEILAVDALSVLTGRPNNPAGVVFLDPPYGLNLVPRALAWLLEVGRIRPGALIVAETGGAETWVPDQPLLAERRHGAARIVIFRVPSSAKHE
jgi:16S rRNA (guanine966-N2)-methyltransferase